MGNKIHCYVVDDEYGARITNIQMYDSIRLVENNDSDVVKMKTRLKIAWLKDIQGS